MNDSISKRVFKDVYENLPQKNVHNIMLSEESAYYYIVTVWFQFKNIYVDNKHIKNPWKQIKRLINITIECDLLCFVFSYFSIMNYFYYYLFKRFYREIGEG